MPVPKPGKAGLIVLVLLLALGVAFALFFGNLGRCLAGGGGVKITPPEYVTRGQPFSADLMILTWGNTGCISKKYWVNDRPRNLFTQVKCDYKGRGQADAQSVPAHFVEDELEEMSYTAQYRCDFPANATEGNFNAIVLSPNYIAGDRHNRDHEWPVPIKP